METTDYGVSYYDATSATQRAVWSTTEADGAVYRAAVTLMHGVTDERGAQGYAWELGWTPGEHSADSIGFHYTGAAPADLIYCPAIAGDDERPYPAVVYALETLAGFVSAWDEAVRSTYPDSENRDLFPAACLPFLAECELFACDLMAMCDEDPADMSAAERAQVTGWES